MATNTTTPPGANWDTDPTARVVAARKAAARDTAQRCTEIGNGIVRAAAAEAYDQAKGGATLNDRALRDILASLAFGDYESEAEDAPGEANWAKQHRLD